MILIISQDQQDATTDIIIDWIDYFGYPFKRLNGMDFYRDISIQLSKDGYKLRILDIDWEEISIIWLRRWLSFGNKDEIYIQNSNNNPVVTKLNNYKKEELRVLLEFFFKSLPENKLFSAISTHEINKLLVLKKALELNINIPETHIMTSAKEFRKKEEKNVLITKSISNGTSMKISNKDYAAYTEIIEELPLLIKEKFSPSLFQHKVVKKYEIRSFLLSGKFYSMAIFSQGDKQTSVDFRKYNHEKPNRLIPIILPGKLESKLLRLASHFGLKTGSFDIIKTMDNEYVFLEVNPGGQFEMVSYPCNYHLERKFAEELIKRKK